MYLDGIETVHNRHERNEDMGHRRQGLRVFTETARPIWIVTRDGEMSQELCHKAHWFLLYNSPVVEKYLEEHKNQLQVPSGHDITRTQQEEYPKWFKERLNALRVEESPEATKELWLLANGPNLLVKEYSD